MSSNFSFWIWGAIIAMALSALFHSLSFIVKFKPKNDTEKQMINLLDNHKIDMGGGIKKSFAHLFIGVSICFTLIYILGAALNFYFLRSGISPAVWDGFLLIQVIVYGLIFLLQIRFTFWPPILVTGLSFIFLLGSYIFK
jgi:hypothetical protein